MRHEHERSFDLLGSRVRLLVGAPLGSGQPDPELAALVVEARLRRLHADLSRFDPTSCLSALNRDPAETVLTGAAVTMLVRASCEAAESSGGLVDAAVVGPLERAGYATSRIGAVSAPLGEALAWAPPRHPARPAADRVWERIGADVSGGTVTRPPGVRIDSGGLGKGLAADLAGRKLAGYSSFAVDCGGDIRIGGAARLPRCVDVEHPLPGHDGLRFEIAGGGVATSGLGKRIWATEDGYSHHLIAPDTGRPAWTGVIQSTALAAETLAKTALLGGPDLARRILAPLGGIVVLDSGEVEVVGPVDASRLRPSLATS